ncbi:hypothetical protein GEMRC1_005801 [Eukaryota sp. GEM-RC1]
MTSLSLNRSCPHFFPLLKRLDIKASRTSTLTSFADQLSLNSTVKEFDISLDLFTSSAITALITIFSSNTTITKLAISNRVYAVSKSEFVSLFTVLGQNSAIKSVDLSNFFCDDSERQGCDVVSPLLGSLTLKSIRFPRLAWIETTVFSALASSKSLEEVFFVDTNFEADDLGEVLICNTYLRKLSLSGFSIDFSQLFNSLAVNSSLAELSLSRTSWQLDENQTNSLIEMLENNTELLVLNIDGFMFKSTSFKRILVALQNNSRLKKRGIFSYAPEYRSVISYDEISSLRTLLQTSNIKICQLQTCEFPKKIFPVLCDLIKTNNSLTFLGLLDCVLFGNSLLEILDVLQNHSTLKTVDLSSNSASLKVLLTVLELSNSQKLLADVHFSPHVLDVSRGSISYESTVEPHDLYALFKALKSDVPVKYVSCFGLLFATIPSLMILYEILAMKKVVLEVDILPHFVDVNNGVFGFISDYEKQISAEDLSSFMCFLQSFEIKRLTLKSCQFHDTAITILCQLIADTTTLTFVEFDNISFINPIVLPTVALTGALKRNSSIKKFVLRSTLIKPETAIAFADVFEENSSLEEIDLGLNSFDDTTRAHINSVSKGKMKF